MTTPANQQNISATNNTATSAASYASAAGVPDKEVKAPVVATGSQAPAAVASPASAQNAKTATPSPVNGKPGVTPAVPAVARGSATNGSFADHARKSSVTMAANGPSVANGGAVGVKSGIQFGFQSPNVAGSTPQMATTAPVPIPGGNSGQVPSPAASPSPIPQPSASGGRPPSGLQQAGGQMTFGSLGSDGERHMRQGSVPQNPNSLGPQHNQHLRRESNHSLPGDNRGNFPPQGGRGRGGFNPHGNNYNNQMGYPPNNQYRQGPGQGRGMPTNFQPQGRNMAYPNSPQPARGSPALVPSMPNTPNMPPANMQPNMSMQTPPQYHYPPPMAPHNQQVRYPFHYLPAILPFKPRKKSKRYENKCRAADRQQNSATESHKTGFQQQPRHPKVRADPGWLDPSDRSDAHTIPQHRSTPPFKPLPIDIPFHPRTQIDLSPESGQYERLLTIKRQNYGGFPPSGQQVDQFGRPVTGMYGGFNNVPFMGQQGSPGFGQQQYPPHQYHHQHSQSMSRTPSQPERPSSTGQQNPPMVVGGTTPQGQKAQPNPAAASFVKPRKSAAITIKNLNGDVVDTSTFIKAPASPASSAQQAKTPPIATSTPTPPPKSSTPSHGRSESQAPQKSSQEIRDELKAKIQQATKASSEDKSEEPKATTESKDQVQMSGSEGNPMPTTAQSESSAKDAATADKPTAAAKSDDPDEDEMERMIREMEEADAAREKAEAEHLEKKKAKDAEAKKKAEEDRKINAAEEDRKLREQEREMERLEEEKEKRRNEAGGKTLSFQEAMAKERSGADSSDPSSKVDDVTGKLADMNIGDKPSSPAEGSQKPTTAEKRGVKAPLTLAPLNTKPVEPAQPSAALQSLQSARFLRVMDQDIYPEGIKSPNPALNAAVAKKGKTFRYDANFLLQFKGVFTEQPSLEFHQQVKSLIGDSDGGRSASAKGQTPGSARQGSRGGAASGFHMGYFNAGRTLPQGTTSAERFAQSSGSMGRPQVPPMASFGRGGFPTSSSMSRTSSQSNMGMPNSPRQSSRSTRGSRRNDYNAKEAQAAKTMPLTAGKELKPITVSSSGWKASSIGRGAAQQAPGATGHMEPELVQRKVKAALNKMTPEKFDRIADQILEIASQSKDESDGRTLRQVIQLTFEKATDEAHWASMYAKFCKRMLETMSAEVRDERIKDKNGNVVSGGNLFRKYLLNRCQEEFERGWTSNLPEPPAEEAEGDKKGEKTGEAAMLSDEYYIAAAAKRRGLGLVQFIGELYKLGMLTERIMHECVHKLVDYKGVPDEAEIESLSKLLRTIGANLDNTEKGRPAMDAYFARIQTMIDLPELQSRMKFMLMDIIDLRKNNWISKEANKGPKTLEEVRAEAEAAQAAKAQEAARSNQRGGGRPPVGRGDARNFSAGYSQTSNQVGMDDLRRLKGSANRTSSQNVTLGPTSMFSSRSNSGRRLGPGGSLGRPGEDSGPSSRTGTPPATRENTSRSNAFDLLADMPTENPASPPSTSASPSMSKAAPDSEKKESD